MARVEREDYGPVEVVEGRHKGMLGYYDDDDGARAIVYPSSSSPLTGPYLMIPRRFLSRSKAILLRFEQWKRDNPDLAEIMGVD